MLNVFGNKEKIWQIAKIAKFRIQSKKYSRFLSGKTKPGKPKPAARIPPGNAPPLWIALPNNHLDRSTTLHRCLATCSAPSVPTSCKTQWSPLANTCFANTICFSGLSEHRTTKDTSLRKGALSAIQCVLLIPFNRPVESSTTFLVTWNDAAPIPIAIGKEPPTITNDTANWKNTLLPRSGPR